MRDGGRRVFAEYLPSVAGDMADSQTDSVRAETGWDSDSVRPNSVNVRGPGRDLLGAWDLGISRYRDSGGNLIIHVNGYVLLRIEIELPSASVQTGVELKGRDLDSPDSEVDRRNQDAARNAMHAWRPASLEVQFHDKLRRWSLERCLAAGHIRTHVLRFDNDDMTGYDRRAETALRMRIAGRRKPKITKRGTVELGIDLPTVENGEFARTCRSLFSRRDKEDRGNGCKLFKGAGKM
ncbi:hypothetical protein FB451DRAFT_1360349 [Mycena latifolia]|nr:hypothetical protein FB451DRAFT_1360349 [Mycena latifolia]